MCTIREKTSRVDRPEGWLRCAAHRADKPKEALSLRDYRKARCWGSGRRGGKRAEAGQQGFSYLGRRAGLASTARTLTESSIKGQRGAQTGPTGPWHLVFMIHGNTISATFDAGAWSENSTLVIVLRGHLRSGS